MLACGQPSDSFCCQKSKFDAPLSGNNEIMKSRVRFVRSVALLVFLSLEVCATSHEQPAGGDETRPAFLNPPRVITEPGPEHRGPSRNFQGIPSLARSPNGRLWAVWYGGAGKGEDEHNYVIVVTSGDDGKTWSDETLVIDPDGDGPVRAFDPELWLDSTGRLWVFWAQAIGHDGSIGGVWAVTTNNPDDARPKWSQPRRLTDGVMMCKPLVLSSGEWVLPASTWRATDNSARMVVSTDEGKTWLLRGAAHVPQELRNFDEHSIVERKDGSLWMLVRLAKGGIGESVSTDRGQTWSEVRRGEIPHVASRFFVRRLASGNLLLVKHADEAKGRNNLAAYVSKDDGQTWTGGLILDERSTVSYPDGVQANDGRIYIIYDRNRTGDKAIHLAVFTEQDAAAGKIVSDAARLKLLVHEAK
jgi:predicted neuraminidase